MMFLQLLLDNFYDIWRSFGEPKAKRASWSNQWTNMTRILEGVARDVANHNCNHEQNFSLRSVVKPASVENISGNIQPATEDMTLANSRRQFRNGDITEKQQEDAKTPNEKTAAATTALHKLTEKLQQVIAGLKRTEETAPTIELLKHHIKRTEDSRKELSKLGSMKKTQRNHQVNLKALKTALHEANKINEQAETTMLSAEAACM